ncbi:MAG: helix-turn-helix domain-containing protein [Clostridia bacterium]|nr:helix-turn-helix domain-containing protein [Clostridia bacterium]
MNRIKMLREELGLSQSEFANKIGLTQQSISLYEKEDRKPSQDVLEALADFFHVSIDYLLGKTNTRNVQESNVMPMPDMPIKVPVIGKISAGLPLLAEENLEGYEFAPSSLIKDGFEYFYLKVSGDSMNLKFNDGDIVLVQKQDDLENDEIGVILVDSQDATVKKYKYENNLVILSPMSNNPVHVVQIYNPKDISIKIIGKVVSYQGKV